MVSRAYPSLHFEQSSDLTWASPVQPRTPFVVQHPLMVGSAHLSPVLFGILVPEQEAQRVLSAEQSIQSATSQASHTFEPLALNPGLHSTLVPAHAVLAVHTPDVCPVVN